VNIIVAGRHIEVTDALRARATAKAGRLARHFEQVQKAQVLLQVEPYPGRNQVAEVTVWADGVVLRGEEAGEDMYAAIDLAVAKIERQIGKFRSKVIDRRRTLASRRKQREAVAAHGELAPAEAALGGGPVADDAGAVQILRRKRFELKPMMPEDAVVQMELLGHAFFMFRNAETLDVNVVYRRADGTYGLIEPEA
jgi:putative sigma-54 modulation protein